MAAATQPKTRGRWPARVGLVRLSDGETSTDGFHRSWVMLFPEGQFQHEQYGELHFTKQRLATIKRQFDERVRHIDIALDANHDQDKATGWLEALQLREAGTDPKTGEAVPAGLWGRVRWTPLGLTYLKDQIYRYFSPEFGPWPDPETGKRYRDVLIGGGLTNRPFLKRMPAVQLSGDGQVSTRPWSAVDKACLPDSAFLDPAHRRLPIYEGAGAKDATGRYTKRGRLNLNGARAALAAIHGGRTGKPMTGIPSGVEARLRRLLGRYGGSGTDSGAATRVTAGVTASESSVRGRAMAGKQGAAAKTGARAKPTAAKSRREREQDLEALLFGEGDAGDEPEMSEDDELEEGDESSGDERDGEEGELAEGDGGMTFAAKKSGKAAKGGKGSAADDAEDAADGGDDEDTEGDAEQYDDSTDSPDDYSMDDGEEEDDTPTEGTSGRASSKKTRSGGARQMSKKASEGGGGSMTMAEQMQLRERLAHVEYQLYEKSVDDMLARWARGQRVALGEKGRPSGVTGPVALSKTFRDAYRFFMLHEGFKLSERHRGGVQKLMELALTSAVVDLSTRGSSFDQEQRRSLRGANDPTQRGPLFPAQQERAVEDAALRLAEAEGKTLSELMPAQQMALYERASKEIGYR